MSGAYVKRRQTFEARLVWQVVVDECVVLSTRVEERAREAAVVRGGHYALVCNILEAWGPWQKLVSPDGRMLRVVGPEVDYIADDYAAWWARVNVPVLTQRTA